MHIRRRRPFRRLPILTKSTNHLPDIQGSPVLFKSSTCAKKSRTTGRASLRLWQQKGVEQQALGID